MCIHIFAENNRRLAVQFISESIYPTFSGSNIILIDALIENPDPGIELDHFYILYPNSNFNFELVSDFVRDPARGGNIKRGSFIDCSSELAADPHIGNFLYKHGGWVHKSEHQGNRYRITIQCMDKSSSSAPYSSFDGYFVQNSKLIPIDNTDSSFDFLKENNFMIFKVELGEARLRNGEPRWFRWMFRPTICIKRKKPYRFHDFLFNRTLRYLYPTIIGPHDLYPVFQEKLASLAQPNQGLHSIAGAANRIGRIIGDNVTEYRNFKLTFTMGQLSDFDVYSTRGNLTPLGKRRMPGPTDDAYVEYMSYEYTSESDPAEPLHFGLDYFGDFTWRREKYVALLFASASLIKVFAGPTVDVAVNILSFLWKLREAFVK